MRNAAPDSMLLPLDDKEGFTSVPTEDELDSASLFIKYKIAVSPELNPAPRVQVMLLDATAEQGPFCITVNTCPALIVYAALPTAESVYVAFVPIAFTVCVVATLIGVE
jgi:hypothetical protein